MPFDFPSSPTEDQIFSPAGGPKYIYKAPRWLAQSSGGASVTISDTMPPTPNPGSLWFESDSGETYIWYDDGTSTQWVQMNSGVASAGGNANPGAVQMFATTVAPIGWLKANGALISRASYATLFTAIGTTWGVGDGSTTFALPDLRGEFLRVWDDARGIDAGRTFGSAQIEALKSHTHTFTGTAMGTHNHTAASGTVSADHTHTVTVAGTSATGSANHGHNPSGGGSFAASVGPDWLTGGAGNVIKANATDQSGAAHTHTVSSSGTTAGISANHTHAITNDAISAGTPAGTNANFGGTETRPRNVALLACIKY